MFGGEVPLGKYVPVGGEAIGKEVVRSIGESLAIIMQNHGVFTIGPSASVAAKMAVEVEEVAKITHLAMLLGDPLVLNEDQLAEMTHVYQDLYGQG
jgi:L-ribulose-5-phosphate 4-epimerase